MHWNRQEQFVFDLLLFVLVLFQTVTFFVLKSGTDKPGHAIFLVGINSLFFVAMIPYAKWVWKTQSFWKAFLQVAKHEIILLCLIVAGILLALLSKFWGQA
jgi:hypothetical protein